MSPYAVPHVSGLYNGGSARNLVYYVLSGSGGMLFIGIALWGYREQVVARVCGTLTGLGLDPPVCF